MVKHTPTIRQQKLTNCLSVFDHFVGFALKMLINLFVEVYSEVCQAYLEVVNYFYKKLLLKEIWQGSEYASVSYKSPYRILLQNTENII